MSRSARSCERTHRRLITLMGGSIWRLSRGRNLFRERARWGSTRLELAVARQGAQLDIGLWDTGGDTRGGDPLWMVLRDSLTGDPLMSIYQLDSYLIENGQFRGEVGIEVDLDGPVCEFSG